MSEDKLDSAGRKRDVAVLMTLLMVFSRKEIY